MLYAKFQDHWIISSVGKIFEGFYHIERGGHLGLVTWTIYIYFLTASLRRLHIKFGFDWLSCLREKDL